MTIDSTSASLLERLEVPGQKEAWDRLVDLYGPFLQECARRLGAQTQDAADLVQEVFVVLLAMMPTFKYEKGKTFRGLLRTIMRNKWLDMVRRKKTAVGAADDAGLDEAADHDALESMWVHEHQQYLVRRGMEVIRAEFEPKTWRSCWESVVVGRPTAEIAAELGITENAVYIAKHRVLRRLRQELEGMLE